jgi:hypothetical protein
MSAKKKTDSNLDKQNTMKAVVDALLAKKEIKSRFQNGESLKKVAKEKGFNIVLPL